MEIIEQNEVDQVERWQVGCHSISSEGFLPALVDIIVI